MKMKKLLAGVLSATMVATMIPASMALGVSAADVPEPVATYDFSADESWHLEGNSLIADGVLTISAATEAANANSASVANPLQDAASSNGFSVAMQVRVTNGSDGFGMMGFTATNTNLTDGQAFFGVEADGTSIRYNDWYEGNTKANYYDYVNQLDDANLSESTQYVLTVENNILTIYCNGVLVGSGSPVATNTHGDSLDTNAYVRTLDYFTLGRAASFLWNAGMEVSSASIYNEALTAEQVAALSGTTPVEPTEVDVTYDLTTEEGREDWSGYTASSFGATYTEGNDTITEGENGVTFTKAGLNSYSIANPLKGNVTDGFTVTVNATIPEAQDLTQYEGFFGFNNHTAWQYWQASNDGTTLQTNSDLAYTNWTGVAPGDNPFYFGLIGTAQDAMRNVEYTLSVNETGASIYLNGELVATYTEADSDYISAVTLGAANGLDWFNLGFNAANGVDWNWFNTKMTVTSVSFSTTPIEDKAQEIADSLELQVIGMQKGYLNDDTNNTAIRMVANMNKAATDANADSIVSVGWAWQTENEATADTTISQMADNSYGTVRVTTVSSDASLTTADKAGTVYGYTLAAESASTAPSTYYAAVPYAVVEVGGAEFLFCYDGKGASYLSSSSNVVLAPTTFAEANVA